MKLLHVDASILEESSVSRRLSAAIVERLRQARPDAEAEQRRASIAAATAAAARAAA